jgi:hypothetical protein
MKSKIIWPYLFILLWSGLSLSAPQDKVNLESSITQSLEEIKNLTPDKYLSEIEQVRANLEKFIQNKKRVCNGEFSSVILYGTDPVTSEKKIKLGPEERKACLGEVRNIQIKFIENLFLARKKYLQYLHDIEVKKMESIKEESIKKVKYSFLKDTKTKKKRRRSKKTP